MNTQQWVDEVIRLYREGYSYWQALGIVLAIKNNLEVIGNATNGIK